MMFPLPAGIQESDMPSLLPSLLAPAATLIFILLLSFRVLRARREDRRRDREEVQRSIDRSCSGWWS